VLRLFVSQGKLESVITSAIGKIQFSPQLLLYFNFEEGFQILRFPHGVPMQPLPALMLTSKNKMPHLPSLITAAHVMPDSGRSGNKKGKLKSVCCPHSRYMCTYVGTTYMQLSIFRSKVAPSWYQR
jgi:hypothetical protein